MAVYSVYEPPSPPSDRYERAEAVEVVREGFNVFAFAAAPVWLLVNRLWLGLAGYLAIAVALAAAHQYLDLSLVYVRLVMLAVHALVALEGDQMRRWSLGRRGWRMLGSVVAGNAEDAERRFFDAWLPTLEASSALAAPPRRVAGLGPMAALFRRGG